MEQPRYNINDLWELQVRTIEGLLKQVESALGTLQEKVKPLVEEALQNGDYIRAAELQEPLRPWLDAYNALLLNDSHALGPDRDNQRAAERASCIHDALDLLQKIDKEEPPLDETNTQE